MSKAFVDELIKHMRLAGIVTKAAGWMVEGYGEKAMNVRYVGLNLKDDWLEVFSPQDNVLLKFVIDRQSAYLDFYLANKPPFLKITSARFTDATKWENLLGEFKRTLKRDKQEVLHHTDRMGNLYSKIKPHLV